MDQQYHLQNTQSGFLYMHCIDRGSYFFIDINIVETDHRDIVRDTQPHSVFW